MSCCDGLVCLTRDDSLRPKPLQEDRVNAPVCGVMRRMLFLAVVVAAVAALLAGTGSMAARGEGTRSATRAASVVISTKTLPKLGTVLVNSKGRTLYNVYVRAR